MTLIRNHRQYRIGLHAMTILNPSTTTRSMVGEIGTTLTHHIWLAVCNILAYPCTFHSALERMC